MKKTSIFTEEVRCFHHNTFHLSSAATALFDCDALSSHYQSGVLQQYVLLLMSYNVTGLHDCACMLDWHDKQLLLFPSSRLRR